MAARELPLLLVRVQGAELLGLPLCSMQGEGTAPQPAEGCLVATWDCEAGDEMSSEQHELDTSP